MLVRKENKVFSKVKKTMKRESLQFSSLDDKKTWTDLMYYCVNVEEESEAKDFFTDLERISKRNGIVLSNGRLFSSKDAIEDWKATEKAVDKWVDDIYRENGEDVDDLPIIGMKYREYGDQLELGIFDGVGGFDVMKTWSFVNR